MKLGIYNEVPDPQYRWYRLEQRGFIRHILDETLIAAGVGALGVLACALLHELPAPLSIGQVLAGATGAGVAAALYSGFSWRCAKKKALDSNS
jgi:hypothetical protein